MSTAVSVPSWVTAVNAAPASLPQKNAEVMRRCADDDTGRNSVSPCTMPRTTASSQPIGAPTVTATHGSAPRARQVLPLGWGREGFVSCGPVEQRRLGTSGLRVSRLALGTMSWGRDTDADEAGGALLAFLDAGGTLVDTADVYGGGEAERILGGLFDDVIPRSEVVVATKPAARREDGPFGRRASRGALLSALDDSLDRLNTDYVDLWQLHAWDELLGRQQEELVELGSAPRPVPAGIGEHRDVLGREHQRRVEAGGELGVPDPAQTEGERAGQRLRGPRDLVGDAVRALGGEHRHRRRTRGHAAGDRQRLPRRGILVLGEAQPDLAG